MAHRRDVPPEPAPGAVLETLERLVDKGVVIDAWARAMPEAIDLVAPDTRLVVASVETYGEDPQPGDAGV